MNKGDLINKVAEESSITKAQATTAVNAMFNAIGSALQGSDKATIIGFGTFSVTKREARSGRNPRTGETITIAAKNVVKFKPGKDLMDSVN
ncbi:MAG: HU family DNA-binding protein [Saprospiraceae bacterium]|nr:HU family DNA-binding protein [Saprospiraceae bacterium]